MHLGAFSPHRLTKYTFGVHGLWQPGHLLHLRPATACTAPAYLTCPSRTALGPGVVLKPRPQHDWAGSRGTLQTGSCTPPRYFPQRILVHVSMRSQPRSTQSAFPHSPCDEVSGEVPTTSTSGGVEAGMMMHKRPSVGGPCLGELTSQGSSGRLPRPT